MPLPGVGQNVGGGNNNAQVGGGGGQAGVGQGQPLVTQQNANNARVFSGGNEMQEVREQVGEFERQAEDPDTGEEFVQQVADLSRLRGAVAGVGIQLEAAEPAVNTPAGQTLLNYDGLPYEAHKRSVSIKKPEILGRFTFRPAFQTAGNNGVSLTSEGAFLDVQINARKIRISDIQSLFDEMSADPESPTGVLAASLVEELETNLTQAEASFERLVDVTNRINQFISSLKIRSVQPKMQERMEALRSERLEDLEFLPDTLDKKLDFRGMMINNHFFTEEQMNEFSSTKLMYYLGYDIKNVLKGPSFTSAAKLQLQNARGRTPAGLDNFEAVHGEGDQAFAFFAAAELDLLAPFNFGVCDSNSFRVASDVRNFRNSEFATRPPDEASLFQNEENTAEACNLLISTISRNLAQSSAIGDDDFMASFKEHFGTSKTNIADAMFASLPRPGFAPNPFSVSGDKSFTKALLYNQPPDSPEILRPFDPDLPALLRNLSDEGDTPATASNTVFNKFIKPILETTAEGQPDASALTRYTDEISEKLRKVATSTEYILAVKNEAFDPLNILNKALLNIKNRLDDVNIIESPDGFLSNPLVDFCLLSESYQDTMKYGEVQERKHANILVQSSQQTAKYYPFNSLITTFLVCLGKDRDAVQDNFFDLVADANADPLSKRELEELARVLAKHARFGLTNATINKGYRERVEGGSRPVYFRPHDFFDGSGFRGTPGVKTSVEGPRTRPGIAQEGFEGQGFSVTGVNRLYTDFRSLKSNMEKVAEKKVNTRAQWDANVGSGRHGFPFGTKITRDQGSGAGTVFGRLRSSVLDPDYLFDAIHKRENSTIVETRLRSIVDGELSNSIYGDIIAHMDELYAAARARGPVVDGRTNKMISSGVDPSVLISFLVSLYAHISNNLFKMAFEPCRMYNSPSHNAKVNAHKWRDEEILPVQMQSNVKSQTFKFKRQLDQYISNDGSINGIGPFKDFIAAFKQEYRGDQAVILDFIDTMRSLADTIETAGQNLKSSFVDNQGNLVDDPDFRRVSSYVDDAVEPSQIILAKNALLSLKEKSGKERFFDDFMVGSAQENFFYTMLKPQRSPNADNMDILPVGIPFGFTRGVLGRNPVLDPEGFNNRLVDVIVYKRDLILGKRVRISQQKFTFDLGMFVGKITDPVITSPETRTASIINPETNEILLSRGVTERNFPDIASAAQNNIEFRRVLYGQDEPVIVPFSNAGTIGTSPAGQVFKNHILDHVGRTYIKLTTGIDVSENNIFIDPEFERRNANESDLASFQALVNARLAQILGREVNFTDYLAGDRATREVIKRLTESERSNPVVSEVRAFLDGNSDNQNIISSEDLVTFTRMLSPNNSLITPGLTRDKITAPKLFERVFCIFVDPDDFDVIAEMPESDLINSAPGSIYLQGNPGSISHIQIPKSAGLPQATTYNVAIKESAEDA
jgi:hypothetical protein